MSKYKRRKIKEKQAKSKIATYCKSCGENARLTKIGVCIRCVPNNNAFSLAGGIAMLAVIKRHSK